MSDRYNEFEDLDAEGIDVSTDTNHQVARDYGALIEEDGIAIRVPQALLTGDQVRRHYNFYQ